MAAAFDAELLDYTAAMHELGRAARLVERIAGPNVTLALACFRRRRRHEVVFTDGEQVGLPYAALCWFSRLRPRHVMIGHRMSARKKVLLHRLFRLQRRVDQLVVYASTQRRFAIGVLGYPPDRVFTHTFMVDTGFWDSSQVTAVRGPRPMICAVGQELRDYPTFVDAVRGLEIDVVIAAASPWSKRADTSANVDVPPNVTVRAYDQFELRQLYADASLVVVPLQENDFQAGITTILEAMSMDRAIICTRTTGQTDAIIEGETGRYVPVGDARALRAAILDALADVAETRRQAAAARTWVRATADIESYAAVLARLVRST